ncbi:hypothetical protein HQQ81_04750 [Microbacteriaceae bacterium VKM Ac-2854]|nr:hypothetical protein [Microbacteriaceae bacterium VKM Ac-2854]
MTDNTLLAETLAATVHRIPGVYALGDPITRMIGVARTAIGRSPRAAGILLDVDPPRLAVRVALVAEYPANVTALADAVRIAIREDLAEHNGPLSIDVTITDVHGPFDIDLPESEPEVEPDPDPRSDSEAQPDTTVAAAPVPLVVLDPVPTNDTGSVHPGPPL